MRLGLHGYGLLCFWALLCSLVFENTGQAQTPVTDSLLKQLQRGMPGKQRNAVLLSFLGYHNNIQRDTLYKYAAEAYHQWNNSGDANTRADVAIAFANAYLKWGWVDSAGYFLREALQDTAIMQVPKKWELKRQLALVYGSFFKEKEALLLLYTAAAEAIQNGHNLSYAAIANSIGSLLLTRNSTAEALQWIGKAEQALPRKPETREAFYTAAAIFTNKAEALLGMKKWEAARAAIAQAEKLLRQYPNLRIQTFLERHKAKYFLLTGAGEAARTSIRQMISLTRAIGTEGVDIDENLLLAEFYRDAGLLDRAIALCEYMAGNSTADTITGMQGVVTKNHRITTQMPYYQMLAGLYKQTGNTEKYARALEYIMAGKDSIYETNKAEAIAELNSRYELSEKERRLALQKNDLLKKDFLLAGIIVLIVLGTALGIYLFIRYRQRQKMVLHQAITEANRQAEEARKQATETERKRIATDLHDNLGAYGAAIRSNLHRLKQPDEVHHKAAMAEMDNNVQHMLDELGNTIWVLQKEEQHITELYDKLKTWTRRLLQSYPDIRCRFDENGDAPIRFSPAQALNWLYIMQEAINNAVRHSSGNRLTITLYAANTWKAEVADNGLGFDATIKNGNGIQNIQERAAKMGWYAGWFVPASPSGTLFVLKASL
ncbi:MAG: histidine kinase [Chitinophagaceae bacterium]|nr:histidine kinase [Chitinophagaceae bacterium]